MAQIMNQKRGRGSSGVGEASGSNTQTSSANQLSRLPTPGTLTDELAALFECPVCFEIVLPPIMQCQVGHLVCSSCRPKLSCCPTCRGTLVSSVTHSTREEMDCRYTKDIAAELHKENDRLEQCVDDLPQETLNRPSAHILPFIREKLIPVGGFTEADACKIQWAQDVMRDYEIRVKGMTDEAEAEVVANLTGRQKFCMNPSDIRNLAMEKVANNLMFPCKHKQTGCRMSLGLNEKAEHEEVCEFRPYSCPCPGASCSWQGQLEKVMVHLQHAHQNITTLNGEDIVFLATEINLPGAVDWVMMQSCFGHHFMLILEKQEKCDGHTQFFAIVQLIGSRKQAEHFAYRLELNGNRRRLTWEAMPRSSHEGVASAIMGSDCLVFDTSIAQLFADNGNLGINVTISVVC